MFALFCPTHFPIIQYMTDSALLTYALNTHALLFFFPPLLCINAWLLCTFPNKSLFSRGWVQLRERDCAWKRESLRDLRVLFCLTSPGQKLLSEAIQASKSACARCLLYRSQGPPELEQRGVCSYCPSPEWQLSVGPRDRLGGPGSHVQGRRTVLTETMSFAFPQPDAASM